VLLWDTENALIVARGNVVLEKKHKISGQKIIDVCTIPHTFTLCIGFRNALATATIEIEKRHNSLVNVVDTQRYSSKYMREKNETTEFHNELDLAEALSKFSEKGGITTLSDAQISQVLDDAWSTEAYSPVKMAKQEGQLLKLLKSKKVDTAKVLRLFNQIYSSDSMETGEFFVFCYF
jgi:hypothetical protein